MALTPEQRRVAQTFLRVAREMGAGPKATKALIAAGLVESGLRNLNYGDRDSLGTLQQRPSQGWGSPSQVMDVEYAARKFLKSAIPNARNYGSAGQLAQGVQKSAFPDRYDERGSEAERIIAALGGGGARKRGGGSSGSSGGPSSSGGGSSVDVQPGDPYEVPNEPGGTGIADLIGALTQGPQRQVRSAPLQAPEFSSARYGTSAGEVPVSGGGPQPAQQLDIAAILEAVAPGPDVSGQVDAPNVTVTENGDPAAPAPSGGGAGRSSSSGGGGGVIPGLKGRGSGLHELFYDPQGGWDGGKSIGAVGGHGKHVHVAAGPQTLKAIAELAKKRGLRVGEFEPYDKVDPVHTDGSWHYKNRAADLSGSPKQMASFTRLLRDYFGLS